LLYTTDIAHSRLQNSIVQLILGDDKSEIFFLKGGLVQVSVWSEWQTINSLLLLDDPLDSMALSWERLDYV